MDAFNYGLQNDTTNWENLGSLTDRKELMLSVKQKNSSFDKTQYNKDQQQIQIEIKANRQIFKQEYPGAFKGKHYAAPTLFQRVLARANHEEIQDITKHQSKSFKG